MYFISNEDLTFTGGNGILTLYSTGIRRDKKFVGVNEHFYWKVRALNAEAGVNESNLNEQFYYEFINLCLLPCSVWTNFRLNIRAFIECGQLYNRKSDDFINL